MGKKSNTKLNLIKAWLVWLLLMPSFSLAFKAISVQNYPNYKRVPIGYKDKVINGNLRIANSNSIAYEKAPQFALKN